jgi:aldehyde:ferredoxin oxidoreductase
MSIKSGYFKKGLHVDLTKGSAERQALPDGFIEKYIGGRGFGAKLVWDNLKKHNFKIDPLGQENLVVVAPGPLTGVYLPSSGKSSFIAISPATGLYGDSSMGGGFGVELRQTGIDVLSIIGKAPELSVLFIDNGEATIIPMPELKGKSCLEAEGIVREHLDTRSAHITTIGPAGENMVKFACVNADWGRNAGRTGVGAIMGSKNLKAIVVRGHQDLPVYDLNGLMTEADKAYRYLKGHKYFRMWQQEGLMNVIDYANEKGILPAYNFKDSVFARHEQINGATMLADYKIGDSACFSCSMCCSNICLVKNGKYTGTVVEGPEYESCAMLGSNLGIDNFAAILSANRLCDELGIDTISTGNIVGAVIEGYEKGILSLSDLDGSDITWGDEDAILELISKIANRHGIGDIIADGSRRIIEKWPEMDKIILHVKGLEQSAYDSRAGSSMALAYATSDIGAHHTRAWTIAKEMEEGQSWSDEEKVETVIYHQKLRPLFDMLGVCRLPWIELGLNERHYANFYKYVTGNEVSLEQLLELSNDIYDLTRLINTHLGMSRKDDSLPYKVWANPPLTGPNAGKVIDREYFQKLLSLYYQKRGWDENGIPQAGVENNFED